ncbi:hypothetical protein A0256_01060 [Mucilaginibacter sp. PAMC 26640]|nr:hypothetical protein A0256_01060 [Mucilaginibacter sp. PAMC 26640]
MGFGFSVVGIGYSAGGLPAVLELFSLIPVNSNVAFVLVPHLLPTKKSNLNTILSRLTTIPIVWAIDDLEIKPQNIYILPENKIMTISEGRLALRDRRPEEIINHAIDIFFLSLALDAKNNAIGILLSGCGDDGVKAAEEIHRNGGTVIAQNPTTAEFPYLPKALISADHPDFILSPQGIADKIKETIL